MTYDKHEKHVVANAEKFTACGFKGRGVYDRREAPTLAKARLKARQIIKARPANDTFNKGRPVLVYAILGVHSVVACTVYP